MLAATVRIARALADPMRLRLLLVLRRRELCAAQLVAFAGQPPSTVSSHLAALRAAGLVQVRREGRRLWYRVPDQAPHAVRAAVRWVTSSVRGDARVRRDQQIVQRVQQQPLRKVARVYHRPRPTA